MSETKNAYVERQRGNLKSWNAEIDKFQARADRATDKLLDKLNHHIAELKEKRTDLDGKVSKIQQAGEEGWEVLKEDTDKTFKSLDKLFKTVSSLFH
jgi:chromosome segregation ATPase